MFYRMKMKRNGKVLFALIGALALVVILAGCATLFKGPTEEVSFGSDPEGAKVYVNGQYMGETPMQLKLESNKSYTFEFRKEGYESKTVLVSNRIGAGWLVLDIIAGLIPVIVDAATGDWFYLDQTNVNAALEAQQ